MIKILFAITFLFTFSSFAQENYIFKSGGKIIQNGKLINPEDVRNLLANNEKALALYEAGRNKKTFGNVLLIGGIAGVLVSADNHRRALKTADGANYTPLIIGGIMLIAAIPIKIGFSNKIKQAIVLMNQDLKNPKTTYLESTNLVINSNGIGFSITF